MTEKTVLVLGGGIGGVTAATHLRRLSPTEHRVVLIERSPTFAACMSHLWVMAGERPDVAAGERDLAALASKGIDVVQAEIEAIDPAARSVQTSAGSFHGDYVVVSLGAAKAPETVPGVAESGLNLYDARGAVEIQRALAEFGGGRIVVLIARTPFSCPSAPYEAAFLIDSLLRERGVRDRSEIALYTPEDQPMLVAGPNVGPALVTMLEERDIELHWQQIAMRVDPVARRILFELDDTSFDLLVVIPPHTVPPVLKAGGLVDASGWVPVDPTTLQTRYAGVFAIGDATAIRLRNGMYLPKAGVFADEQARTVAARIVSEASGDRALQQYGGRGFCYIEVGDGLAAYGAGNFYATPAPSVTMESPSQRFREEKAGIERALLAPWD